MENSLVIYIGHLPRKVGGKFTLRFVRVSCDLLGFRYFSDMFRGLRICLHNDTRMDAARSSRVSCLSGQTNLFDDRWAIDDRELGKSQKVMIHTEHRISETMKYNLKMVFASNIVNCDREAKHMLKLC